MDTTVLEDFNISVQALEHAAEISPFVTERTIGPDIEINWDDPNISFLPKSKETIKCKKPNFSITNEKIIVSPKKSYTSATSVPFYKAYDEATISASIILDETYKCTKRKIWDHINNLISQEKAMMAKTKTSDFDQNALWYEEKKFKEAQIIEQAELEVAKEIYEAEQFKDEVSETYQQEKETIVIKGIIEFQEKFHESYGKYLQLLQSIDKQQFATDFEYFNSHLKDIIEQFDVLLVQIKNGNCSLFELKTAAQLNESLLILYEKLKSVYEVNESLVKQREETVQVKEETVEPKPVLDSEIFTPPTDVNTPTVADDGMGNIAVVATNSVINETPSFFNTLQSSAITMTTATSTSNFNTMTSGTLSNNFNTMSTSIPAAVPNIIPTENTNVLLSQTSSIPTMSDATELSKSDTIYASQERVEFYNKINAFYQAKVERVKPLQNDDSFKKYRAACQKVINIPINAIAAVNPQHLRDKFEKLYNFISGQPTKIQDGIISVNDHPLGRDYCMLLMTKKMVKQGDSQIASSAPAAYPIASVAISLWKLIPDFGILFLAYLFKESPYLCPYYIPQQPQQSVEDYFKALGYAFKDGVVEKQDLFLTRHAGFARLFSAIMITNGRQADGSLHPYSLDQCWIWLTNLVNLEPMPDICATVLSEVLHVVSAHLFAMYGKQFIKLLVFIRQSYLPKVKGIDTGGATTRLELMLDNCLMKGLFPTPTGLLPQNFW